MPAIRIKGINKNSVTAVTEGVGQFQVLLTEELPEFVAERMRKQMPVEFFAQPDRDGADYVALVTCPEGSIQQAFDAFKAALVSAQKELADLEREADDHEDAQQRGLTKTQSAMLEELAKLKTD